LTNQLTKYVANS